MQTCLKIKEIRKAAGMSQEKLGAALGLDQSIISRLERGQRPITLERLCTIAEALNVSVHDLIEDRRS